ncbi:carboxypeptidase-like regulatory domain-containing protein, partial [Methanopyrus sp.]
MRVTLATVLGLLAALSPAAAAGTLDVKDVQYPTEVNACQEMEVKFKVVDASTGQPVPGASVIVRIAGEEHKTEPPESWERGHYAKAESDSEGNVTAKLTAPGNAGTYYIWVKVEKEGYETLVKNLGELKVTGSSTCEQHQNQSQYQHQSSEQQGGGMAGMPVSPLVIVGALCALAL